MPSSLADRGGAPVPPALASPHSRYTPAVAATADGWRPAVERWIDILVPLLGSAMLVLTCLFVSPLKPMWADELFTHALVTLDSPFVMLRAIVDATDTTPPLFHLLTWVWVRIAGASELSLRMFSALGMCVALVVHYGTVRRTWGAVPAALPVLGVMLGSNLVLYQAGEARFYGLFLALAAIAIELAVRAAERERPGRLLLAATLVVHAMLVMTHVYGALYSGVLLCAMLVRDLRRRERRIALYGAVVASWIPLAMWIPALINHADVGKPESWVMIPDFETFVRLFAFDIRHWVWYVAALALLLGLDAMARARDGRLAAESARRIVRLGAAAVAFVIASRMLWFGVSWWGSPIWPGRELALGALTHVAGPPYTMTIPAVLIGIVLVLLMMSERVMNGAALPAEPAEAIVTDRERARSDQLLLVGAALFAVPFMAFVISHVGPSIFVKRYMIPTILIWSIGGAWLLRGIWSPMNSPVSRRIRHATWALMLALAVLLLARPMRFAADHRPWFAAAVDVAGLNVERLPIATEDMFLFLPARFYLEPQGPPHWLLLDSALVFEAPRRRGATTEFKLMTAWRRNDLAGHIASAPEFLCAHDRFMYAEQSMFHSRILRQALMTDPAWVVTPVGKQESTTMYRVERVAGALPRYCGA